MTSIKPRTASVVIYQGDDLATLGELRQAAEVAGRQEGGGNRLGDAKPGQDERDAYDAAVIEAAERAVTVEILAIGRKRFRDLLAEHPPRQVDATTTGEDGNESTAKETHPNDAGFEVNTATFSDALLTFIDGNVRTIAQPEFSTRAAVQAFLDDELADGDYESIWMAAYWLNRGPSADPLGSRYSSASQKSSAI